MGGLELPECLHGALGDFNGVGWNGLGQGQNPGKVRRRAGVFNLHVSRNSTVPVLGEDDALGVLVNRNVGAEKTAARRSGRRLNRCQHGVDADDCDDGDERQAGERHSLYHWIALYLAGLPLQKPLSQMRRNTFLPLQPAATRSFFGGFGLTILETDGGPIPGITFSSNSRRT